MRKFLAYQNTGEPLQIKSVVSPEGLKGYIYIEAYKQPHVKVTTHLFYPPVINAFARFRL